MSKAKITDFRPQQRNANKHNSFGLRLLEDSIQRDGFVDAQTAAADGEIISGSARLELAAEKFADVEPIVIDSDGTRPIIIRRTDIPNAETARARRLSVAANAIAKADFNPDGELLKEWAGEDDAIRKMFADSEWTEITGDFLKVKTLDELEKEYGNSEEDDFHPFIKVKVSPEIKERFDALMVILPGANEMEKIDALISRGELS
jgi:hypothetical protein